MNVQDSHYASLLRQYPEFTRDGAGIDDLPTFTYIDQDAPPLVELRERFQIRERIDGLNDVDAILALLKWIYDAIPYDGSADIHGKPDSLSILSEPRPVNCYIKAMVLNEVYLSAGFKSRILLCFPADYDHDNHVITMVYADSLGKWITVDPSHDTYFMSDDGLILNAIEARDIYASGGIPKIKHIDRETTGPIVCGGISCASFDEFYLLYMCKNLFWFRCPARSEYWQDAPADAEDIFLSPLGYDRERGAEYDKRISGKFHYVSNVEYFLTKPF